LKRINRSGTGRVDNHASNELEQHVNRLTTFVSSTQPTFDRIQSHSVASLAPCRRHSLSLRSRLPNNSSLLRSSPPISTGTRTPVAHEINSSQHRQLDAPVLPDSAYPPKEKKGVHGSISIKRQLSLTQSRWLHTVESTWGALRRSRKHRPQRGRPVCQVVSG
jgi:hypothetical protein